MQGRDVLSCLGLTRGQVWLLMLAAVGEFSVIIGALSLFRLRLRQEIEGYGLRWDRHERRWRHTAVGNGR